MQELTGPEEVESAVSGETCFLYKHSFVCPISAAAHTEMEQFVERHPEARVYLVDVNASTEASRYVEESTEIKHDSPQLILFRNGEAVWNATHFDITASVAEEQLRGAGT
jgi:bacillithiol system protein YtxJ